MNKHPLFKNMSLEVYKNDLIIEKYPVDSLLFTEGEECDSLGVILSGKITISTLTNLDKEYVINILGENDIFGENLLFTKNNHYLGDAIVTEELEIIFIKKEKLIQMFSNKTFLINYLTVISEKNTLVRQRLKLFSQKNIEDRIMFFLINERKRLNSNKIPIKSKEDLALLLNIPRPSLSRELIKLKEKGLITYNKYFINLL